MAGNRKEKKHEQGRTDHGVDVPQKGLEEVGDQKNGLFDPVTVEDQTKFNAECEKAMEKKALERGLLEQAQENAEEILGQLLEKLPGIREGGWKLEFQTAEE